jgi:hypothetical protein
MAVDTARFQGDLGKAAYIAEARMRNIRDTARKTALQLSAMGTVLAGALIAATKSGINAADEMKDLAAAAGTTTEEMSRLGYAADQSGSNIESLQKAMAKLAQDGVVDTAEAIKDLADEFKALPDGALKTARAMDIFGERIGPKLIPLLNEGRAGIEKLGAEADILGITIDSGVAAAASNFNDQLTTLNGVAKSFKQTLAAELLPSLNQVAAQLVDAAKRGEGFREFAVFSAKVVRGFASAAVTLGAALDALGTTIGARAAQLAALGRLDLTAFSNIGDELTADLTRKGQNFRSTISAIWNDQQTLLMESAGVIAKVNSIIGQGDAVIEASFERSRKASEEAAKRRVKELEAARRAAAEQQQMLAAGYQSVVEEGLAAIQSQESPAEAITRQFEEQRYALEQLAATYPAFADAAQEALARAAANADEQLEALKRIPAVIEESASEMSVFAEQAGRNLQDSFARFLFDPFKDGLNGMVAGFADTLRQMVAELAAKQLLLAFFNWAGGLGGGIGSFFSGMGSGISPRASGGPVAAGGAYLVGERGPELFMPRSSGTIVPNGAMAGVTVNYSIDARGADADRIMSIMPGLMRQTEERTVARVQELLQRGRLA